MKVREVKIAKLLFIDSKGGKCKDMLRHEYRNGNYDILR